MKHEGHAQRICKAATCHRNKNSYLRIHGLHLSMVILLALASALSVHAGPGKGSLGSGPARAKGEPASSGLLLEETGAIVVEKQAYPDGSTQRFEFATNYSTSFGLADGETRDSGPLEPGTYSVSEVNIPPDWTLTSATCTDGSNPSAIDLDAGETVTCVFHNTRQLGTIMIQKLTHPDVGEGFGFLADTIPGGPDMCSVQRCPKIRWRIQWSYLAFPPATPKYGSPHHCAIPHVLL